MSDLPKIGTVVLNFRTYNDTLECVDSLKQQTYDNHSIIIVENGSGNESEEILKDKFDNDPQITILVSKENLGFAKGNNIGIRYAREKLNCDYVFVLNSDTIVPDGVFCEIIKVNCDKIGAISPQVVDIDGKVAKPSENSDDIYQRIKYLRKTFLVKRFVDLPIISKFYVKHHKNKKKNIQPVKEIVCGKYVLQGCSYFLTPTFFKYYTQLFPNTFLYWEEINLLVYLEKAGLYSVLVDTPPILHKEKSSTKALLPNNVFKKRRAKYSNDSYNNSKFMYKMNYEEIKEKYN